MYYALCCYSLYLFQTIINHYEKISYVENYRKKIFKIKNGTSSFQKVFFLIILEKTIEKYHFSSLNFQNYKFLKWKLKTEITKLT